MPENVELKPVVFILEDNLLFSETLEDVFRIFQPHLGFEFEMIFARAYDEALKELGALKESGGLENVVLAFLDLEVPCRSEMNEVAESVGYGVAALLPRGCNIYCTSTRTEVPLPPQALGHFEKNSPNLWRKLHQILTKTFKKKD